MRLIFLRALILIVTSVCCLSTSFAQGGDIVVKDTSGITRNVTSVEDLGKIEFQLTDANSAPAEGAEVTITSDTGQTLTAISSNGVVSFEGVPPGVWTVASTSANVTFTGVTITSAASTLALSGLGISTSALVIGGGVTAAAATGIAIAASNDNGGSDDTVLSPSS